MKIAFCDQVFESVFSNSDSIDKYSSLQSFSAELHLRALQTAKS